jgi:hypothetical protein
LLHVDAAQDEIEARGPLICRHVADERFSQGVLAVAHDRRDGASDDLEHLVLIAGCSIVVGAKSPVGGRHRSRRSAMEAGNGVGTID